MLETEYTFECDDAPSTSVLATVRRAVPIQAPLRVSLLCVGDELLDGAVNDELFPFVTRRFANRGVRVDHVHYLPDDVQSISSALLQEFTRSTPRLILTSGGLGPTHDDLTYNGVAAAIDTPLTQSVELADRFRENLAIERLDDRYMEESIRRMARIPAGSRILDAGGWRMAVAIDRDGGWTCRRGLTILPLPGVPTHFRQAFDHLVIPEIGRQSKSNRAEAEIEISHSSSEHQVGALLRNLSSRHPLTSIQSLPGVPSRIILRGPSREAEAVARQVLDSMR